MPKLSKNSQFFSKKTMIFEKKTFTLQRICVEDYILMIFLSNYTFTKKIEN